MLRWLRWLREPQPPKPPKPSRNPFVPSVPEALEGSKGQRAERPKDSGTARAHGVNCNLSRSIDTINNQPADQGERYRKQHIEQKVLNTNHNFQRSQIGDFHRRAGDHK